MGQFCPGKGGFDNLDGHVQHERQAYMPVGSWTQDVGIIVERTFLQFPTEKEGSSWQCVSTCAITMQSVLNRRQATRGALMFLRHHAGTGAVGGASRLREHTYAICL